MCLECLYSKSLTDFDIDRTYKGRKIYDSRCKSCVSKTDKARYQDTKKRRAAVLKANDLGRWNAVRKHVLKTSSLEKCYGLLHYSDLGLGVNSLKEKTSKQLDRGDAVWVLSQSQIKHVDKRLRWCLPDEYLKSAQLCVATGEVWRDQFGKILIGLEEAPFGVNHQRCLLGLSPKKKWWQEAKKRLLI